MNHRMSSSSSFTEDNNMHQFVDRVLVKMGKDELVSLFDITLDCLEEGKELSVSHSKLKELTDEGMLQLSDGSIHFPNKIEGNNHIKTVNNNKITSMFSPRNECNTDKQIICDFQHHSNSINHKKVSDDSYASSDQEQHTKSSSVKNKKYSRKRSAITDVLSSNSCESEPVPKKLRQSKQKKKSMHKTEEFVYPVITESRNKKIEDTKTGKNKSHNKASEKSELTSNTNSKAEVQFQCDKQHWLRTNHKNKLVDVPNDVNANEKSSAKTSRLERNTENMPLSQRLKIMKCKSKTHLKGKQNKTKLEQESSEKCNKRNTDSLEEGAEQKKTCNSSKDIQKPLPQIKVSETNSSPDLRKMKSKQSIAKSDTLETKTDHKSLVFSDDTKQLENTKESSTKSEHLSKCTIIKKKGKECDKYQKISPSLDKSNRSNSVDKELRDSKPVTLRIKSSVKERNDLNQSNKNDNDAEGLQKKTKRKLNKQENKNVRNVTSPSCKYGFSSLSEKQTFLNKTEQVMDTAKKQNEGVALNEKEMAETPLLTVIESVPLDGIDVCENDIITSDIAQLSSLELMFPRDNDDTAKESSTEYETMVEPDLSDRDNLIFSSVSETEINCEPQNQTSSSLDDDSSDDEKRHTSRFDTESDYTGSDSKYEKLKEQFQRAGLDLDTVAQLVDEQELRKVVHKAGNDGGMLLRFPHFCPCSKKHVGQCLVILNSRTQYIKAKEKRPNLEK